MAWQVIYVCLTIKPSGTTPVVEDDAYKGFEGGRSRECSSRLTKLLLLSFLMKLVVIFVVAFILMFIGSIHAQEFKICQNNPTFIPSSISTDPERITPNTDVTVTIIGTSREEVAGGKIQMHAFLRNIRVYMYEYDMCEVVQGGCPVKVGSSTIVIHQKTPAFALPGIYTVLSWVNEVGTNRNLTCIEYEMELVRP